MDVSRHPVPVDSRVPTGTTNAYLLGDGPAILVDPPARTDELDAAVEDRTVQHVLVTHAHRDHVGAVDAYATQTGATVWARYGRVERFREATGLTPDRTFVSGTTIPVGDDRVRILDAPGHAPDHVALEAGRDGPVCCGDCAVRDGSVVVGAPEGDMRAYLTTLRRLWAIDPPELCPGHGPPIDDPAATLERLLAHRYRRERRILAAVDDGARTLEEVLTSAYEKDLTGLEDLARATAVAHLEKLAVEERLEWDGVHARSA
ncbi:MBL fold metallo-hydrolase [Natrarchaeobaculum sulfurireducens]|uniref:Hydroxyacylglutathione hydrolase n=1 Tax=Natrarchaeobaculum sulfurireducens TaxID=2044521 RepID=A0A346PHZ1_9EURY|nr:MBL fold metallo-hydrolase [Natrarchaeobaculum sulfurireducens]AXR79136.1 Metal-dependent hydrolase of the beta-lactamase superfamily II [Natrarchaeobaculum sulfurireducens]AXR80935.1 Hydroxyacylglutathione hydrolase [Natrarchaeobaculum sulfurireducens]